MKIVLHFASMLLHFAAILITFCVSITICGDYYILRRNKNVRKAKRALQFLVHFSTVTARLRRENADDEIFFFLLNLGMVLRNSNPGELSQF